VACAFYGCSKSILFGSLAARPEASWRSYSVPARRQGPVLIAALVRSARIIVAIVLIHRGVTPERRVSGGSCTQTEGIVMGRIDRSKELPSELRRTPPRRSSSQNLSPRYSGGAYRRCRVRRNPATSVKRSYRRIRLRHLLYALHPFATHRRKGGGLGTVVYC
jgi:hypothetical protein